MIVKRAPLSNCLIAGFSLGNLLFISYWIYVWVPYTSPLDHSFDWNQYYRDIPFDHISHLTTLMLAAGAGCLLTGLLRLAPRLFGYFAAFAIGFATLTGLNALRENAGLPDLAALVASVAVAILLAIVWWRSRLASVTEVIGVFAAPLLLLVLVYAGAATWRQAPYDATPFLYSKPLGDPVAGNRGTGIRRVVWLLFDRFDYDVAFARRDPAIEMPVIDDLRQQAFFATEALSTAAGIPVTRTGDYRLITFPSLLAGRNVVDAVPVSSDELLLWFEGDDTTAHRFSDYPTIFDHAIEDGARSAAFGMIGHPYCQLFHRRLADCEEVATYWKAGNYLLAQSGRIVRLAASYLPVVGRFLSEPIKAMAEDIDPPATWRYHVTRVSSALADPDLDFIYAHLNLPHGIYNWDLTRNAFVEDFRLGDYTRNQHALELLDRTVGMFLDRLRDTGLLDDTVIVISGDRGELAQSQQPADLLVPFMVRFPGEIGALAYDKPFSTLLTGEIIRRIRTGEIDSGKALAGFLDAQPGR